LDHRSVAGACHIAHCCCVSKCAAQIKNQDRYCREYAPVEPPLRGPNTKEGASQASKSAKVLTEVMGIPAKGIPRSLLAKAECIAVFPKVLKAGFILGGSGGRGVASCRTPTGWSAPAYFEIKGRQYRVCRPEGLQPTSCCFS